MWPNMIQLWLYLHLVCDLTEGWLLMTPDERLEVAIIWQPED